MLSVFQAPLSRPCKPSWGHANTWQCTHERRPRIMNEWHMTVPQRAQRASCTQLLNSVHLASHICFWWAAAVVARAWVDESVSLPRRRGMSTTTTVGWSAIHWTGQGGPGPPTPSRDSSTLHSSPCHATCLLSSWCSYRLCRRRLFHVYFLRCATHPQSSVHPTF